ncbi:MAG: PIN domain-containing protein [Chloroflexi bacterium]|nr:PIN domain-containing protein [Chloroflexota bacterium]
MSDFLLDTTVFIDYYRGDPSAQAILEGVLAGRLSASFSPMSVLELWMGNLSSEEEGTYRDLLSLLEEATLTSTVAEQAARLLKGVNNFRETLIRDALIAATALQRNEPIYTRNTRDCRTLNADINTY